MIVNKQTIKQQEPHKEVYQKINKYLKKSALIQGCCSKTDESKNIH